MALTGTLDDFGLANIFQLLGQGQKTGVLSIHHAEEEVKLFLTQGAIIRCEASSRERKLLLGAMLIRAEVILEADLARALEIQRLEKCRLGDCLVKLNLVAAADLSDFTRLQTQETVLRALTWQDGRYSFTVTTQAEPHHSPIRVEAILLEAFRQAEEWPTLRRALPSYGITFRTVRSLEEAPAQEITSADLLKADSQDATPKMSSAAAVEEQERQVYRLVTQARDLQKLIDLSRLGEFETMRSLVKLLESGYIAASATSVGQTTTRGAVAGPGLFSRRISFTGFSRGGGVVLAALAFWGVLFSGLAPADNLHLNRVQGPLWAWHRALGAGESHLVATRLDVYKALRGRYPDSLIELESFGLLPSGYLSHSFALPWVYEPQEQDFVLAPPLY